MICKRRRWFLTRLSAWRLIPVLAASDRIAIFLVPVWKIYDDEREEIITYVSTYDIQGQSIKATKVK